MPVLLLAGALGLSLALTACGSNDNSSGSGDKKTEAKIGVILPDTESSVRWESADRPALEKAFKDAGVKYDIQNAQGDADKMAQIADSMITSGVTVLAIVNLDNASGAAIQEKAKNQGIATIDYDRLTLGGSAAYYVSYDNEKAGTIFEQMYTQQKGKIDGVLAANDGLGGSAIAILDKNKVAGKVPVTGQDATTAGLQNVLAGTQCMTVYKSAKKEAAALSDLAIGLAKGEKGETNGTSKDDEGNRDVPSVLLDPVSVTKDNVKEVIDDGGATAADVCKGYEKQCAAAGIS